MALATRCWTRSLLTSMRWICPSGATHTALRGERGGNQGAAPGFRKRVRASSNIRA